MNALVKSPDPRRNRPSASSMQRYSACHGSWLLEQQVPPEERFTSKDAALGTKLHEANETGDVSLLELSEQDLVVRVREQEERIYHAWKDEFNLMNTGIDVLRERRWWLNSDRRLLCSAQLDFVAIAQKARMALCLDLKSGRKEVPPSPRNMQLRTGAVILSANYNLVHCRVGIVAPLQKVQPLSDYSTTDLFAAWTQLEELLEKISDPNAKRSTGTHCEHCTALHICPEARAVADSIQQLAGLKWATLAPAQKLVLWEKGKVVGKIIEQIERNIAAELRANPDAIPGLVKRPDTEQRQIKDVVGLYDRLLNFGAAPREELIRAFNGMCKASVGALEEFVRTWRGGTKKEATAFVNSTFKDQITLKPVSGCVERVKE